MLGLDDPLFNFRYSARFLFLMYGTSGRSFVKMMSSGELGSQNLNFPKLQIPLWVGVGANDELFSEESVKLSLRVSTAKTKSSMSYKGLVTQISLREALDL